MGNFKINKAGMRKLERDLQKQFSGGVQGSAAPAPANPPTMRVSQPTSIPVSRTTV